MRRRQVLCLVLLGAVGCSEPAAPTTEVSTAPAHSTPIELPSCAVGTRIASDGASCVAVGPTTIPAGFVKYDDDWGFKAQNPYGLCAERFFSKIGRSDCEAIDHRCPVNFAPANAMIVRDQAELLVALATSKPGATIALAAGTYGPLVIDRDVHLIGECPEKTTIKAPSSGMHAIEIGGAHQVSIRSITVRDSDWGLWAGEGAKVDVT